MKNQAFYYYLKDSKLSERTIEENVKDLVRFSAWAQENNFTDVQRMNYNELLQYVQHLKKESLSIPTINIRVNSLRKYYDHLKEEGTIEKNPVRYLHIKGTMKRITENPLTYTQLETLYNQYTEYSSGKEYQARSLVMLGLMIWQGVHGGELVKMEVSHVKLNSGTVYIPSTRRSNSRELKLEAKQIITLNNYLSTLPQPQEKLFEGSIRNWVTRLTDELKGINPTIKNAQHIRASVLLHWIKMYGKRQVQYMAGHRWISSTERYEVQELDSLNDSLAKHHPFS
jgi:site-specific recombinase XerD